jgi:hypothetical protein
MIMVLLVAALPQTVTAFLDRGTGGTVQSGDLQIQQDAPASRDSEKKQDDQPELNFSTPEEEKKK